jgi:ABC-type nitrate/sulfonate/bicarbonate transport system ATPase subunit
MLEATSLSKSYPQIDGSAVEAIDGVSLTIKDKEFVALIGPSGCGKTTFLRVIAGLEKPSAGHVTFNDRAIHAPSRERGMVFQNFSSFPWLSVADNIAFGLRLHRTTDSSIKKAMEHYLRITELEQFRDNYPGSLSGGMQQRVAIARTLANQPRILLLDEPFGSLDAQTRSKMQEFLAKLWEEEHKTVILVTHDIEEAIFLADRVLVLTPRPMKIKKEFHIPFARPRMHELKLSNDFFELKKKIMALL